MTYSTCTVRTCTRVRVRVQRTHQLLTLVIFFKSKVHSSADIAHRGAACIRVPQWGNCTAYGSTSVQRSSCTCTVFTNNSVEILESYNAALAPRAQ
jgi:hypothetical protein